MAFRVLCCWLIVAGVGLCEQKPITVDGEFADWGDTKPAYTDSFGDLDSPGLDFGRIWLADDDRFLFIRIETAIERNWNNSTDVRLFIDTDSDSATGLPIAGIGAELEWRFGNGNGLLHSALKTTEILGSDIRLRGAPSVSSQQIELAIGKDSMLAQELLFSTDEIRVALMDSVSGDQIPNQGEIIGYQLNMGSLPKEKQIPLDRNSPADLRMITHNVLFDRPWNSFFEPSFGRQWSAVDPDILNLQEIYEHTATETIELVSNWVALPDGQTWYAVKNSDCITVSKFPILASWPLDGNLAVLVDATEKLGSEILIINAHLPCCGNDMGRQFEIDRIMSFIRDAKTGKNNVNLKPDTPIFVTGDLNLVRLSQQLTSLLTGEIINQGFGESSAPDWDGTTFANVISRQTEKRMGYTWRSDQSLFWPGKLDYVVFSDSVIELQNHFILFTPEIENPNELGLESDDSLASDHLILCTDFRSRTSIVLGDLNMDGVVDLLDVDPFVGVLTSGEFQAEADINSDGVVDLIDVVPFVELLTD